ncbi:acrB/AcrD/AcrF family protein [Candidatus Endolissoclinum faulkneri L5]|uniref:AcrB/AcrD/AcrF family protein n=1 Tax=Candidatus Endolissoclinum faulkneri L5 TaxID=1401328 RepID=V9TVI7_9PROT|nr:efflux RND transporter permease subunit [Candidatus Endolissoclinum faulkneri]AHC73693.1 acrB/AcrD/AcrF family protein [Candidatus Endolissoclinum faulkneri L5]
MILSDIFIRRPVFAIVVNALIVAISLYGLFKLSVGELPSFNVPVVTINTALPGASSEQIETQITTLIEERIGSVPGIDYITSTSTPGMSSIVVTFRDNENVDNPLEKIRAKLDLAIAELPIDANTPLLQQHNTDEIPVIYLSLSSNTRSAMELTELIQTVIRTPLTTVSGVGEIKLLGERKYAIRVHVYPSKLAAYGLTTLDIKSAVQSSTVNMPMGDVELSGQRINISADTALATVREFENIPILNEDRFSVRLKDVADVIVAADSTETGVLINGHEGLAISVLRASDANSVSVAKGVNALIPQLRSMLPIDVNIEVAFDSTVFIQDSIAEVFNSLIIAVVLVVIVVLLFLGSLNAAFIILITIPISLIGTFSFMNFMNYSLNTFSLLAMVLAVGLVVDDAIVDVENVQRLISRGLSPLRAAFIGSREIGFAIVATTLTLASVYLPIGFLPGIMGKLFSEFAFTLVSAVIISGFTSRTLSPMMCAYLLRPRGSPYLIEQVMGYIESIYRRSLDWALHHRGFIYIVSLLAGGVCTVFTVALPSEVAPSEDRDYIYVQFSFESSISYDRLHKMGQTLSVMMDKLPERKSSLVLLGTPEPSSGIGILMLTPSNERKRSAHQVGKILETKLLEIPGLDASVLDPGSLSGGGQQPVQMVVRTIAGYESLAKTINVLLKEASGTTYLSNPTSSLEMNSSYLKFDVDRSTAGINGVKVIDIASTIATATSSFQIKTFTYGGKNYNILLELDIDSDVFRDIGLLEVPNNKGKLIPLHSLVSLQSVVGATRLEHFNGQRSATIKAGLRNGAAIGAALGELQDVVQENLPPTSSIDWLGATRQLKQANASLVLVFLLALLFIYGFLATQFESFRDPFVVLLVVPFSVLGGTVVLSIIGGSINLYSGVGMVTLIGLIAKQGILVTEFANQLREGGLDLRTAIVDAAVTRLRPILMTSISMISGALPMLYSTGSGAHGREHIAAVIVGGMIIGTILALYLVPVTYTFLSRRHRPILPVPPSQ